MRYHNWLVSTIYPDHIGYEARKMLFHETRIQFDIFICVYYLKISKDIRSIRWWACCSRSRSICFSSGVICSLIFDPAVGCGILSVATVPRSIWVLLSRSHGEICYFWAESRQCLEKSNVWGTGNLILMEFFVWLSWFKSENSDQW